MLEDKDPTLMIVIGSSNHMTNFKCMALYENVLDYPENINEH